MEELYLTIHIDKGTLERYRTATSILKSAIDALDKATSVLKESALDDGGSVEEAAEAVRKAKYAKAQAAELLAEEVVFSANHPETTNNVCKPGPKTRAEQAREAVEAIKAKEAKGPKLRKWYMPDDWADSDVGIKA